MLVSGYGLTPMSRIGRRVLAGTGMIRVTGPTSIRMGRLPSGST